MGEIATRLEMWPTKGVVHTPLGVGGKQGVKNVPPTWSMTIPLLGQLHAPLRRGLLTNGKWCMSAHWLFYNSSLISGWSFHLVERCNFEATINPLHWLQHTDARGHGSLMMVIHTRFEPETSCCHRYLPTYLPSDGIWKLIMAWRDWARKKEKKRQSKWAGELNALFR